MAMRPGDRSAILQSQQLDAPTWEALEKHWLAAIRAGFNNGDPGLLHAYDAAFVASLERQRGGPITRAEHASIAAGRGRGRSASALAALGLPTCAAMPHRARHASARLLVCVRLSSSSGDLVTFNTMNRSCVVYGGSWELAVFEKLERERWSPIGKDG